MSHPYDYDPCVFACQPVHDESNDQYHCTVCGRKLSHWVAKEESLKWEKQHIDNDKKITKLMEELN